MKTNTIWTTLALMLSISALSTSVDAQSVFKSERDALEVILTEARWDGPSAVRRPSGSLFSKLPRIIRGDAKREADRASELAAQKASCTVVVENTGVETLTSLTVEFKLIDIRGTQVDKFILVFAKRLAPGTRAQLTQEFSYRETQRDGLRAEARITALEFNGGTLTWKRRSDVGSNGLTTSRH